MTPDADAFREFETIHIENRHRSTVLDRVAVELPLEVRLHGYPFAVIMRTPGSDEALVLGFLLSEGVIRGGDDVSQLLQVDDHLLDVRLSRSRAEILPELLDSRRNVATNASCGMCGRRSLESLEVIAPALAATWSVSSDVIESLPRALRSVQRTFEHTGGLHAAGLFDLEGVLELSDEDVGRHNAVDKLLGRMLTARRLPLESSLLMVSGRTSFEIVQKAFVGGIPLVAAVSAPSSFAITLAGRVGITLLGFVRESRFNIYTHAGRITLTPTAPPAPSPPL
jgi:FdhD protein